MSTPTALLERATQARERAWAPYSRFFVGAAGLLSDGTIVTGANVENASYGLTVCAERHVVANAVLAGQPRLQALAVVVDAPEPVTPCGACRQVLAELCEPSLVIYSRTLSGMEAQYTLGELLPHAFGPGVLAKAARQP